MCFVPCIDPLTTARRRRAITHQPCLWAAIKAKTDCVQLILENTDTRSISYVASMLGMFDISHSLAFRRLLEKPATFRRTRRRVARHSDARARASEQSA